MAPQKHMEALKFKYNFGFFIITNIYLDFNNERDTQAVRKRLLVQSHYQEKVLLSWVSCVLLFVGSK